MKLIPITAITIASIALCGNAFATLSTDVIDYTSGDGLLLDANNNATGTFSVVGVNGFLTGNQETVTDVQATFVLDPQSQSGVPSSITFDLDSILTSSTNSTVADGDNTDYQFMANSTNLTVEEQLESTGTLSFTIMDSNSGSNGTDHHAYVDSAGLTVTWSDPPPPSVPDNSSTMALLGMVLVGISAAARRFGLAS